jgi:hypothetical protein
MSDDIKNDDLVVKAGSVTVLRQVGAGKAYVDVAQGEPVGDLDDETRDRLLASGAIGRKDDERVRGRGPPGAGEVEPDEIDKDIIPAGSVEQILGWVGDDLARARVAREMEEAKGPKARATLLKARRGQGLRRDGAADGARVLRPDRAAGPGRRGRHPGRRFGRGRQDRRRGPGLEAHPPLIEQGGEVLWLTSWRRRRISPRCSSATSTRPARRWPSRIGTAVVQAASGTASCRSSTRRSRSGAAPTGCCA